jgi:hypothetical protein
LIQNCSRKFDGFCIYQILVSLTDMQCRAHSSGDGDSG